MPNPEQKLIVILGPTASGKSELAVNLAKKFKGEVVSADSRQVYREMNIGTGKITRREMRSIPHHLLSIVSPRKRFTVIQYRKLAARTINKIFKKGRLPILCGGTGFYIRALIDGIVIPEVKPDRRLRRRLERLKTEELFKKLKQLDPRRAKTIEKKNRRRLIRALEIIIKTKKPIPSLEKNPLPYPVLMIGINPTTTKLEKRITERVGKMIKTGLEKEVRSLVKKYNWVPALDTIGYQEWNDYFNKKITLRELEELIIQHTLQLAKQQMNWFKYDKRIHWINNKKEVEKLLKAFLVK